MPEITVTFVKATLDNVDSGSPNPWYSEVSVVTGQIGRNSRFTKEDNLNFSKIRKCYNIWNTYIYMYANILTHDHFLKKLFRILLQDISSALQRVQSFMQIYIPCINSCLRSFFLTLMFNVWMTIKSPYYKMLNVLHRNIWRKIRKSFLKT